MSAVRLLRRSLSSSIAAAAAARSLGRPAGRGRALHTQLHRRAAVQQQHRIGYGYSYSSLPAPALRGGRAAITSRSISYSYIPRLVLRASTRLPVVIVGGTAAGGAYVVAKVEAARNSVYGTLDDLKSQAGLLADSLGRGLGEAGRSIGEGVDEARDFSTGVWASLRSFVGSLVPDSAESEEYQHSSNNGGDAGNGNGPSKGPLPDRIAAGAAAAAASASTLPIVLDDNEDTSQDTSTNDLMLLTKKLIEIRSILLSIDQSEGLQLPAIVVTGSQSSGKSSVLEAVVGREFLPKGNNMVTRRPIELTLIHTPATPSNPRPQTYAEFPVFAPGQNLTDFSLVQKTLYDLNMSIPASQAVSSIPIELRIHSPNVPDLSLVDLPGYIELSSMDQPDTLKEEIANLVEKYIKPPNIILAVCSADVDLANSPALRASRRVDPLGMRTIGVVTKMDLVDPKHGVDILTNKRYPLSLGYVGVVCKAAAKSREGTSLIKVRNAEDEGLSGPVRQQERAFFGSNKEHFSREGVQVTTDHLKKRLMQVLEESMANSLHSISNNVALELEEAKYQFKVQYNDRRVSPQSYMTETLDTLKARLHDFSTAYAKSHVRKLLKANLDDDTMEILAKVYWQDISEAGSMQDLASIAEKGMQRKRGSPSAGNKDIDTPSSSRAGGSAAERAAAANDPETIWKHKLEAASSALTKSGVGRKSTQLIVDAIRSHTMHSLMAEEPLIHHPTMTERITALSDAILRDRYTITAEQVENCIKPYKYEIELDNDGKEWEKGRSDSVELLKRELEMCDNALAGIRDSVGGARRLNSALKYVKDLEDRERKRASARQAIVAAARRSASSDSSSSPSSSSSPILTSEQESLLQEDASDPSRPVFNPSLLAKAREANFLTGRTALLRARMAALKSRQCKSFSEEKADRIKRYCPEAFLNVVADKLATTAVMFINIELLQEYFYLLPREIESRLGYELAPAEVLEFARENPSFRAHLDLQERKDKLELVTEKLDALLRLQQERQGPFRHPTGYNPQSRSGSSGSGKRFGFF